MNQPTEPSVADPDPPGSSPALIELVDVSRTFDSSPPVRALRQVNLRVERGEYVGVVGPSGSGKSTFLNVVGLLDRPTGGTYMLDGDDASGLSDRERAGLRARRIGFIFQSFHLLPQRSALENVMFGALYQGVSRRRRRQRALDALDRVGVADRASFRPSRLSGGERQRVAIARALSADPSLLLCDEPTGNLDTVNTAAILGVFDGLLADGLTILMITHDLDVARHTHRRVSIVDGRLTEMAEPVGRGPAASGSPGVS
jgi:putative ABC transport system ATP-binding protein